MPELPEPVVHPVEQPDLTIEFVLTGGDDCVQPGPGAFAPGLTARHRRV